MPHLFSPYHLRSMTLRNRIVMSPMCMYAAGFDGIPGEWHLVHLGTRAVGGAGLIWSEATAVEPRGRISAGDLGLWDDRQAEGFAAIARFVHGQGAAFGIQLAHAGRKAWSSDRAFGPELPVAPSAIPYGEDWQTPQALAPDEIQRVVEAFRAAAARARDIGCDCVEVHAAHGYLIHQFLSPLANHRSDEHGGALENRVRLLRQVVAAVREVFPTERPVWVRISATDWVPGGWDAEQSVALARQMRDWGVDLVDCSSGGLSPQQRIDVGPGYQVPFAAQIRREAGIATAAVGLITAARQADDIVRSGQADLVICGRELLRNPYFPLQAAAELGAEIDWPQPYLLGRPANR